MIEKFRGRFVSLDFLFLFQRWKKKRKEKKTHLNTDEIEKRYGNRVRSRLRAMFNLVSFNQNSIDKRK